MTSRLVLHLGAHKTATTAIQHYCTVETQNLRAAGIVYIGHTTKPYSTYRTLRDLTTHARGEGEFKEGAARLTFMLENARKVLARTDVTSLLVPWEILIGEPYIEEEFALYPRARASLEAMAEALRGLPISVVFTIREQGSFLNSWYLQLHKLGRVPDPDAYRSWAREADLSWKPTVTAMRDCFGQESVKILYYDLTASSPARYFKKVFKTYGIPKTLDLAGIERKNLSWPAEAIEIARHVMPRLADERERYAFRLKMDEAFSALAGRPLKVLDEEARRHLVDRYCAENRVLAAAGERRQS